MMEPEVLDVLKEAVERRQRKEDLERSIGRALRRRGMGFQRYVQVVSVLREMARKDGTTVDDAARKLLGQQKDEGK